MSHASCRIFHLLLLLCVLAVASGAGAARGGPDTGGWSWADSREPGVDTTVETLLSTTSLVSPWSDEQVVAVPLSFPFQLYGTTSSTVWLSSNGWLSLVDPGTAAVPGNRAIPDGGAPSAFIAFYWDDLTGAVGTGAQHGPTANGHLIQTVHLDKVTGGLLQADIQFYRNGSVKVVHRTIPVPGTVTIGIEDGSGAIGTQIYRDGTPAPGYVLTSFSAILFHGESSPPCAGAAALACGTPLAGNTALGTRATDRYACSPSDELGAEVVYTLTLTSPQAVNLTLGGLGGRDQDLFLMRRGCDTILDCLAGGGDVLALPLLGPGTYYVVVDGKTPGDDGAFTLTSTCTPASIPIACGQTLTASASGPSAIDSYRCRAGNYSGAEEVFHFSLPAPRIVTATIAPATSLDLFLAGDGDLTPVASGCLASGDARVVAFNLPAGNYALVADGATAGGSFDLTLACATQVAAQPIACGQIAVPGSSAGASLIDSYSCLGGTYPQGEAFYRFRPTARVIAQATPGDGFGYDIAGFREAEGPGRCLGGGDTALTLVNLVPEDYLLALDSRTVSGPTDLSLSCLGLPAASVACDTTISAQTGPIRMLSSYSCLGRALPGDEAFFVFQNPTTQSLLVAVEGAPAGTDLDVAIVQGPFDPGSVPCLAGGGSFARLDNAPPGEYLIVVDGATGAGNVPFELTTLCNTAPLECGTASLLGCNARLTGDTASGRNSEVAYAALPGLYTGPELVYRFDNPVRQAVNFLLRNPSDPRLDLILLSACDSGRVIDSGDEAIIAPALDPGTYYLVVDGRERTSGTFELVSFCGAPVLDPPVFRAEVPVGECVSEQKTLYYPTQVPAADVMFCFDVTGSMRDELDQVKQNAREIYQALGAIIPSLRFGLSSMVEFNQPYVDTVCNLGYYAGGYPYRLDQPLTADINLVDTVLQSIPLVGGGGGPGYGETYTHTFYQAVADLGIGWGECSRRIWVSLGDEPAMDCNFQECIGGVENTGRDPGPDNITGTPDDLLLIPTVDRMAANGIVLIPVHSSENVAWNAAWDCLGRRTGGRAFLLDRQGRIPDGTNIVEGLVEVIEETLRRCPRVLLRPTGPYASWVTVTPAAVPDVTTPWLGEFRVDFCVPAGTAPGAYSIPVEALCEGAGECAFELIGNQSVEIEVTACAPPPLAEASATPGAVCAGADVTLDGSASTACNGAGLEYRWLDGATEVCGWSASPTCAVTPQASTTYTLEVRCRNLPEPGCIATDPVRVEVVPVPVPALAPLPPACASALAMLDASASDPAGCPVPLEYRFRQGAAILRSWDLSPTFGPVAAGVTTTYSVDVRCNAQASCEAQTSREVTVVAPPAAEAGPDQSLCVFERTTLTGSAPGESCPGGVLYEWWQGATLVRPALPDPTYSPPTTDLGTRTYTLVVLCAGMPSCRSLDEVAVTVDACGLAVEFSGYEAVRATPDGPVEVRWSTASEDDTLGFVVERRPEPPARGERIGQVTARGAGATYTVGDDRPAAGELPWYRVVEMTGSGRGDSTPYFQARGSWADTETEAVAGRSRTREPGNRPRRR